MFISDVRFLKQEKPENINLNVIKERKKNVYTQAFYILLTWTQSLLKKWINAFVKMTIPVSTALVHGQLQYPYLVLRWFTGNAVNAFEYNVIAQHSLLILSSIKKNS